jgi:hypothetical protein
MTLPQPKPLPIPFDLLVIRLTRQSYYADNAVFQLTAIKPPFPIGGGAFRIDTEDVLDRFRRSFNNRLELSRLFYTPAAEESPEAERARQLLASLGEELFALLPQAFQEGWPLLLQQVFERGHGLRLVLETQAGDQADQLLSLPWELLYFKETRNYPARAARLLVVRRLLGALRRSPLPMKPPYNVIHVIAHEPTSPPKYWIDEQLQQVERDTIPQAISPGVYTRVERPGSVEALQQSLTDHAYHIVHFLGHGELLDSPNGASHPSAPRAYLRFNSAAGQPQWVSGDNLQLRLSGTPSVQLLVLNACHGGSAAVSNLALELLNSGLPYVIAIQSDILQDAAQSFVRAFYTELQQGRDIDYAVAAGRAAIATDMPAAADWCLPVFYTNVGLPNLPAINSLSERIFHWIGTERGQQGFLATNQWLGVLSFAVGLLLLISGTAPARPDVFVLARQLAWLVLIPPLAALAAYHWAGLAKPALWPGSMRAALGVRMWAAATITLGLLVTYAWLLILLMASTGFWALLSPQARAILFIPLPVLGSLVSYAQAMGFGRAFISNSRVEWQGFQWDEFLMVVGGYVTLAIPLLVEGVLFQLMAPPRSIVLIGVGVLLLFVRAALRQEWTDPAS